MDGTLREDREQTSCDPRGLRALLARVAAHEASVDDALDALRAFPYQDLGFAKIDHHRSLRRNHPEAIYAAGKTPQQVARIFQEMARAAPRVLATRATVEHRAAVADVVPDVQYDAAARMLWLDREPDRPRQRGIVVVAAGTSDLPVAEEACRALDLMGHAPQRVYDIGVAGLHRCLAQIPVLRKANVLIVAAGMEGALPSVIAGLVAAPVVAVPTNVGYGASFGGLAALLGMLNSCSPGISVVNIDNGYGAAHVAAQINELATRTTNDGQERDGG